MTKSKKAAAATLQDARDSATTAGAQAVAAARYAMRGDLDTASVHVRHMIRCIDVIAAVLPSRIGPVSRWEWEGCDFAAKDGEPSAQRLSAVLMGIAEFLLGCAEGLHVNNLRVAATNLRFVFAQQLQALQLLEARAA